MHQQPGSGFSSSQPSCDPSQRKGSRRSHRLLYAAQVAPLIARDQLDEAEPILRLLVQARSQLPEVYRDLAELERRRGHHGDAKQLQEYWLRLPADSVVHLWHQATIADNLGLLDLALERYQQLLQLDPQHQGALERASALLLRAAKWAEAQSLLNCLLEQNQSHLLHLSDAAFCSLMLHKKTRARHYANLCLGESLLHSANPDYRDAQAVSRAVIARLHQFAGEETAALAMAEQALEESTAAWPVSYILAPLFLSQQILPKAAELLEAALLVLPTSSELHLLKADLLLLSGELQQGFQEFEWRHEVAKPFSKYGLHSWKDSHSEGPIILLAEGSLGDTLLFSRYACWIQKQTQKAVVLYVQPPLQRLLSGSIQPCASVLPYEQLAAQRQGSLLPLLSAPALFGTCQEHLELSLPHLHADPKLIEYWRQQLNLQDDDLLIGINWHGSALHALSEGHRSDIPLELFAPLAELFGARLVAFQKGIGSEELDDCTFEKHFVNCQSIVSRELRLEHMAALMALCDWVVSDDSGPAHLAGNLGIPSLVLLPERINWRWTSINERSPWYPNSRLLRQQPGKGWQELMEQACLEITANPKPRRCV